MFVCSLTRSIARGTDEYAAHSSRPRNTSCCSVGCKGSLKPSCSKRRGRRAPLRSQSDGRAVRGCPPCSRRVAPRSRIASIVGSRTGWRPCSRRISACFQRAEGRPGQPEAAFAISGLRAPSRAGGTVGRVASVGLPPPARRGTRQHVDGGSAEYDKSDHSIARPATTGRVRAIA
jgi:hypothetical protein